MGKSLTLRKRSQGGTFTLTQRWVAGTHPMEDLLMGMMTKHTSADVVVIGSHGSGVFQGLLGSTGTKIVRRSPRPVLLIRSATS